MQRTLAFLSVLGAHAASSAARANITVFGLGVHHAVIASVYIRRCWAQAGGGRPLAVARVLPGQVMTFLTLLLASVAGRSPVTAYRSRGASAMSSHPWLSDAHAVVANIVKGGSPCYPHFSLWSLSALFWHRRADAPPQSRRGRCKPRYGRRARAPTSPRGSWGSRIDRQRGVGSICRYQPRRSLNQPRWR